MQVPWWYSYVRLQQELGDRDNSFAATYFTANEPQFFDFLGK
jgi:hypothetical protein